MSSKQKEFVDIVMNYGDTICGICFGGICLLAVVLSLINEPATAPQKSHTENEVITAEIESHIMPEVTETKQDVERLIPCIWGEFNITLEDFELICRTVYCEAGNQSIETQIMVALTILNRTVSDIFPYSISEVIYQTEPAVMYSVTQWTGFEEYGWTEQVEQAVTYALEHNEYPLDMFYFRTRHYHRFGVPYMQNGDLYFSTED